MPELPKPRNPLDFGITPRLPHLDPGSLRFRDDPIEGPNTLEDEPHSVRYTVKRVKHHVPCDLPRVYFQFDSDEDVGSFTVTYRLVAANIRKPERNDLHVKLSVSEAIEPPSPEKLLSSGDEDDDFAREVECGE